MMGPCGIDDCDCEHTIEELKKMVREFAAHPCVDCEGCSVEAERRLTVATKDLVS